MTTSDGSLWLELGEELKRQFKARCAAEGTTMTAKVKEWVGEWVEEP